MTTICKRHFLYIANYNYVLSFVFLCSPTHPHCLYTIFLLWLFPPFLPRFPSPLSPVFFSTASPVLLFSYFIVLLHSLFFFFLSYFSHGFLFPTVIPYSLIHIYLLTSLVLTIPFSSHFLPSSTPLFIFFSIASSSSFFVAVGYVCCCCCSWYSEAE